MPARARPTTCRSTASCSRTTASSASRSKTRSPAKPSRFAARSSSTPPARGRRACCRTFRRRRKGAPPPRLSRAMNVITRKVVNDHACGGLVNGRYLFMIPWRDVSMLGTSHDAHDGTADQLKVSRWDLEAFLKDAREAFPHANLTSRRRPADSSRAAADDLGRGHARPAGEGKPGRRPLQARPAGPGLDVRRALHDGAPHRAAGGRRGVPRRSATRRRRPAAPRKRRSRAAASTAWTVS